MKVAQNNTKTLTALLCNDERITTFVKNSCCVAASIINTSSSTDGGLIPHEKLREAAAHNATLTAQIRPLAQLAQGYKRLSKVAA